MMLTLQQWNGSGNRKNICMWGTFVRQETGGSLQTPTHSDIRFNYNFACLPCLRRHSGKHLATVIP